MNKLYLIVIAFIVPHFSCFAHNWTDIEKDLVAMQKQVNAMITSIQEKFEDVSDELQDVLEKPAAYKRNVSRERVHIEELFDLESKNGDKQTVQGYQVVVDMPGFQENSIDVTLEKQRKKPNVLVLKAKKDFQPEVKAKDGSYTLSNESYSSKKTSHARLQTVNYQNGLLVIRLELPAEVDVDGSYTMTFEGERLIIKFSVGLNTKASSVRKLSLKEKKIK